MTYQIVHARIVNEGTPHEGSLSVEDGRIVGIDPAPPADAKVIDAEGAYLLPGLIDDQVHFREPGFEHLSLIHI